MSKTKPPPSDGPMSLLFDVWLLNGLSAGYLDRVLTGTGLTGDDFGMYALLARFGPASPTQLQRWTGQRLTTVSAHLKRIEQRGHLQRTPNPDDRRSQLLRLSDLGAKVYEEATEPFLQAMHSMRSRFDRGTLRERLVLQELDSVLRRETGMDPRPYQVDASAVARDSGPHALSYTGEPLAPAQEEQVRVYLDFVRRSQA